jgi:hypothetical protein
MRGSEQSVGNRKKEFGKSERNGEQRFTSRVRDSEQSVRNRKLKNSANQRGTWN